jgi:coproporphyrinogen III oxidase-like Fe-S oxidoreductase
MNLVFSMYERDKNIQVLVGKHERRRPVCMYVSMYVCKYVCMYCDVYKVHSTNKTGANSDD